MTVIREGDLVFDFGSITAHLFDDSKEEVKTHGVSEMCKVDIIAEFPDYLLFIEVKDLDDRAILEAKREEIERSRLAKYIEGNDLANKYKESYLYLHLMDQYTTLKKRYVVLIAKEEIADAQLAQARKRVINQTFMPGPFGRGWAVSTYLENAAVFDLKTWREFYPEITITRVP
ncbi:hypothetical protein [Deinococcus cellulosilyticus]|uniref:Uncharacterized protein n=1 Tax=Deinococcus cellulosilyticus (strain DSM 18568 / NBRC 106333 / KACC 11606 / 5516J-15) TaxID=1223518 RepID=A0A511N8P5_DEIC1|nr:hypothetical protein [Deinococcus cellulosilyticus]GEM49172.1 hypothetical protein DC3_48070 [Deinococcus cellulosilyticus NBRC 106333 = KACC 11606]